jgi:hypothetical protein
VTTSSSGQVVSDEDEDTEQRGEGAQKMRVDLKVD